jgi:hypothetical protein
MTVPGYFPKHLIPDPRHVVSMRRLVKTPPGSEPVTLEPTMVGAYWDYPVAHDHAALVCDNFRLKGFTITEIQCEGPVKWEAAKLDRLGNWIIYEIYITTISF